MSLYDALFLAAEFARMAHANAEGSLAVTSRIESTTPFAVLAATGKNPERLRDLEDLHLKWFGVPIRPDGPERITREG